MPPLIKFDIQSTQASNRKPDLRNRVEKMFYSWNSETGEKEELQILMFDGANGDVKSLGEDAENCIAILQNYKANVSSFEGSLKGKTVMCLGGCRPFPNSLGSLLIPLDEADDFCDLAELVTAAYLKSVSESA